MPLTDQEKQQLFREIRRDAAERYRLQVGCARMGVLDAVENDEPLREFAIKMLKRLGLKIPADPVEALTSFIEGHEAASRARDSGGLGTVGGMGMVRGSGMDSDRDDFISRYLRS